MALTHFDGKGDAHMVDVSDKAVPSRVARAESYIKMAPETLEIITEGRAKKGDVLGVARLAGIMAAKRTAELIPLCHPLPLSQIDVSIGMDDGLPGFTVEATVRTEGRTGVEMEALTAVSVACLTLFDMLKAVDREMTIGEIRITAKEGGKSGDWQRA